MKKGKANQRGGASSAVKKKKGQEAKGKTKMRTVKATKQRTKSKAAGQRQVDKKGKAISEGAPRQLRSRSRVQLKTSKPLDKQDTKRMAKEKKEKSDQKKNVATKGARSVKVTMAKHKMKEEKKRMGAEKKKKDQMQKKTAEEDKKVKTFQQDVQREIDRLKAQEKEEQKERATSTSSGVVTRHTRRRLLESKRKREMEVDYTKGVKKEAKNEGGSTVLEVHDFDTKDMVEKIKSEDPDIQLSAAKNFRKLLAKDSDQPKAEVIQMGVVPKFVKFLRAKDSKLQFEAASVLMHVTSGTHDQAQVVIDAGAMPVLIKLLRSSHEDVQEQAVWALGNIAEHTWNHKQLLHRGILSPLLALLSKSNSVTKKAVWALSNLCKGRDEERTLKQVSSCLPVLSRLLSGSDQEDVLVSACSALSHLTHLCAGENVQAVIDSGVCPRLVELLKHSADSVVSQALGAIGNIAVGTDDQTQVAVDCSVLPCLLSLLSSSDEVIRKNACWMISNITAGNDAQVQAVFDGNIIPTVIDILGKDEVPVRKEAARVIANATVNGQPEQTRFMADQGCIKPLCDMLTEDDSVSLQMVLSGLENILKMDRKDTSSPETSGRYRIMIRECGGLDKLQSLKNHSCEDVNRKSSEIVADFHRDEN